MADPQDTPQRRDVRLAIRNVSQLMLNRAAKLRRQVVRRGQRSLKPVREMAKALRASARGTLDAGRDAALHAYVGVVRTARYWRRLHVQTTPRLLTDLSVRRELRSVAGARGPIIVGPWLSEVGYEVLYWVPFLRWYSDRYGIDPSRLVVVSRGGVASWYRDVAAHYVELLDLFDVPTFAARNAERQRRGEQKQHAMADFDREILARVREQLGGAPATVCHPSVMFRLLRQFWLGNASLQYVQEHTKYARVDLGDVPGVPLLPERFVAMKFYSGKAIPATERNRQRLRMLVERVAADSPIVVLDTGLAIDEHQDLIFDGIPGVMHLASHLTPQRNLGVQAAVIQRASAFVGTCGGLAWLAPLLGTRTLAVYADDELLAPHLYAAQQAYKAANTVSFSTLDMRAFDTVHLSAASFHVEPSRQAF
jgi:hypothetical protein